MSLARRLTRLIIQRGKQIFPEAEFIIHRKDPNSIANSAMIPPEEKPYFDIRIEHKKQERVASRDVIITSTFVLVRFVPLLIRPGLISDKLATLRLWAPNAMTKLIPVSMPQPDWIDDTIKRVDLILCSMML